MGLAWERLYLRLVLKLVTDLRKQDPEHREGLKKYGFFIDKDIEDYFLDADVRIIFRSCIEPLLFWHSLNRLSAVMSYVPGKHIYCHSKYLFISTIFITLTKCNHFQR